MESAITRRDELGAAIMAPVAGRGSALRKPKTEAKAIDPLLGAGNPFAKKATPVFAGFEPGALGSLAVLALLVGGLGYGGWTLVQEIQRVQVSPVEEEPTLLAELDPLTSVAPIETAPDAPEVAGVDVPATEALSRLYRPQALDAPILTARDQPISTINPSSNGALASTAPSGLSGPDAAIPATPDGIAAGVDIAIAEALRDQEATGTGPATPQVLASEPDAVVVVATREAWIRIRTADGAELLERVLQPGETYEIPASEGTVSLRTGNTGAVYFSVAGATYGPVAPGPQVATTEVSAATIGDSFAVADLTDDSDIARIVAELAAERALPGREAPAE